MTHDKIPVTPCQPGIPGLSAVSAAPGSALDVAAAARLLREGALVCYPTETFFAVGCSAFDVFAINQIFAVKKRAEAMPLPVIIGDMEQLAMLTDTGSRTVEALAKAFWPGPLSVLVTASVRVPAVLTGESGRVAVRLTPHPVARELCREVCGPLVSTSANISGRAPVTAAQSLDPELVAATGGVLDMPPAPAGGKASTLVEIAGQKTVRIVRHGAVDEEALRAAGFAVVI